MLLVLDEERERVRGLRVGEVHVGIARADVHVEHAVALLRDRERTTQQEVTHGLRVLARLTPVVGSPSFVRRGAVRGRRIRDVQARAVGDDRLEPDQPRVVRRRRSPGPRTAAPWPSNDPFLARLDDPRLDPADAMHRHAAERLLEFRARDRGLRVALVGDDRDDVLGLEQPAHVAGRVGAQGGVTGRHHRVLRGLAPQVLGDPPAQRQAEHRGLGELLHERRGLQVRVVRGEQGGAQEHAPRLERSRIAVEQILGAERMAVRVDDVGAGQIDLHRSSSWDRGPAQNRHRRRRIISSSSRPSYCAHSPRRVARKVSNRNSPIASREHRRRRRAVPRPPARDAGSCRTPRAAFTSSGRARRGPPRSRAGGGRRRPGRAARRRAARRSPGTGSRCRRPV